MNKADLIKELSKKTGNSQKASSEVIDSLIEIIENAVSHNEKVKIVGFGTFQPKHRAPKKGVNPKDPSQKINIPAKTVPAFVAGKEFKALCFPEK